MKLKERLRIAWQVLTKGTCDELEEACDEKNRYENARKICEIEKRDLHKLYLDFREFILLFDRPNNMLCIGDGLGEMVVADFRFKDYEFMYPYVPRKFDKKEFDGRYCYTLYNATEKVCTTQDIKNSMFVLDCIKTDAAAKLSKMLIRDGILKMDIVNDPCDPNINIIRFSIPFYKQPAPRIL